MFISPKIIGVLILITISSCVTPVNLNFESSRMLEKGDIEFQVSGSTYQGHNGPLSNIDLQQSNFGVKLGIGVTEKYNIKFKFESLNPGNEFIDNDDDLITDFYFASTFIEFDNKISLGDGAALSLPLGVYEGGLIQFDPRFYFTFAPSDKFELTFIPKLHMYGFRFSSGSVIPGISIGAGFSSDLNRWSIRPEIGYDRMSLSAGISYSHIFRKKKKDEEESKIML